MYPVVGVLEGVDGVVDGVVLGVVVGVVDVGSGVVGVLGVDGLVEGVFGVFVPGVTRHCGGSGKPGKVIAQLWYCE